MHRAELSKVKTFQEYKSWIFNEKKYGWGENYKNVDEEENVFKIKI